MLTVQTGRIEGFLVSLFGRWVTNQYGVRFGKVYRGKFYVYQR